MAITGDHVRMLRGALRLTVREFAKICRVDKMTVSTLERGAKAQSGTQDKIREAFAQYVEFIEPVEGVRGAGIVMKWGVEPIGDATDQQQDGTAGTPGSGLHSRAWDEDFDDFYALDETALDDEDRKWLEFIRTNPELSDNGRRILMKDAVERYSAKQRGDCDGLAG